MARRKPLKYDECHKIIDNIDHKFCVECLEWMPCNEEFYSKNKSNSMDGFNTYCRKCNSIRSRKSAVNNMDHVVKVKAEWHKRNKTKNNKRDSVWYQNNKEYRKEYLKQWFKDNYDKHSEYRNNHRDHDISDAEWESCKEYFNYECCYCGLPEEDHKEIFDQQLHKEHVDHEGANDLSNCAPSCQPCNSRKWQHPLSKWYTEENEFFSRKRLKKLMKWLSGDYLKFKSV